MEIISALAILVAIALILRLQAVTSSKRKVFKDGVYSYLVKESLMTRSEEEFYWKLLRVVDDRYFLFPQVHLSSLLDHRVKGQDWRHAFRHINGKSVDYVLCSKLALQPMYAIELDDESHNAPDRVKRDIEVERIFEEAGMPLVRFKNYKDLSEQDIIQALTDARKLADNK